MYDGRRREETCSPVLPFPSRGSPLLGGTFSRQQTQGAQLIDFIGGASRDRTDELCNVNVNLTL